MSINVVVIEGRLVRDPEVRKTPSGVVVADFTVAVDRRYKSGEERQADFIRVTAWRGTAEFVQKYFSKGDGIHVFGRLRTETFKDKDGNNRTAVGIQAEEVGFPIGKLERMSDKKKSDAETVQAVTSAPNISGDDYEVIAGDDDLPF